MHLFTVSQSDVTINFKMTIEHVLLGFRYLFTINIIVSTDDVIRIVILI